MKLLLILFSICVMFSLHSFMPLHAKKIDCKVFELLFFKSNLVLFTNTFNKIQTNHTMFDIEFIANNNAIINDEEKPLAPTNLVIDSDRHLTWDAQTGVTYNVYRRKYSFNDTILIATELSEANYTDTENIKPWKYYYYVTAVNNVGESEKSNSALYEVISKVDDFIQDANILIYPNPSIDEISISFVSNTSNYIISILNSVGIEIKRIDGTELQRQSSISVSTVDFPSGIYYCILNTGKEKFTKSFVVIR